MAAFTMLKYELVNQKANIQGECQRYEIVKKIDMEDTYVFFQVM